MGCPHSCLGFFVRCGRPWNPWGVCATAPGKVLFTGTDALLTTLLRGGSGGFDYAFGPLPKSNKEMGLAPMKGDADKAEVRDVQCFDTLVVKGDTQKSDEGAVPVLLWIHAFLQGYGQEACLDQHLSALLPPAQALAGHLRGDLPPSSGIGWALLLVGFCCLGLRWWRRNLLRGFHTCGGGLT
jgi:hypothetical protein